MRKKIGTKEAAVLFNRHRSTIRRWLREGRLPGVKRGGRWAIDAGELSISWNVLMSERQPSPAPAEDFRRFRQLIEDIESGNVGVYEDAQRRALGLALSLLATRDGFRRPVWEIISRVREGPAFGFFNALPDFAG